MPNISELKDSKFLTKADCGPGILLTIRGCAQENVAQIGAPEDLKWCLHFEETDKPMVLNMTNAQIIAGFIGSDDTENWTGHKVVIYTDPNVMYAGKRIGGIRARAPKNQPAKPAAPAPRPAPAPVPQQLPPSQMQEPPDEDIDNCPF